MMDKTDSNTYCFHCEVVEVISTGAESTVKMICNPGSIIIEFHNEGKMKMGDRIIVTGNLDILSTEKDCNSYSNHNPNN